MAGKALNKKNLLELGPDALADLLLEAVKGDAARQRRVRMALSADQGSATIAADIRKRHAAIRRAKSYIGRKTQKTLAKELTEFVGLIETKIAPDAPDTAFELLWAQLHLAEGIYERTDDSRGTIGDTMRAAVDALGTLAPSLTRDPETLADDLFEALVADGYGAFDYTLAALAPALGETGLAQIKTLAETARDAPLTDADLTYYRYIRDPEERDYKARQSRNRSLDLILRDIADEQGDVDAWLAQYSPEQLRYATIAPEAAMRLLDADRAEEALALLQPALAAPDDLRLDRRDLDNAHFACLLTLGRKDDLRDALWQRFETRLCPAALREHIKLLPDFEDIEAEDAARTIVRKFPHITMALQYCDVTKDMALAAEVINARAAEIDGDHYEVLTPLAEALRPTHPLQAVLLWRFMIDFALDNARKGRYRHAANHLSACAEVDAEITDYRDHPTHTAYVMDLRARHERKASFWI